MLFDQSSEVDLLVIMIGDVEKMCVCVCVCVCIVCVCVCVCVYMYVIFCVKQFVSMRSNCICQRQLQ